MALSDRKLSAFAASQKGTVRPVLWETCRKGIVAGFTDNYLRVSMPGDETMQNSISKVKILDGDGAEMQGEAI